MMYGQFMAGLSAYALPDTSILWLTNTKCASLSVRMVFAEVPRFTAANRAVLTAATSRHHVSWSTVGASTKHLSGVFVDCASRIMVAIAVRVFPKPALVSCAALKAVAASHQGV